MQKYALLADYLTEAAWQIMKAPQATWEDLVRVHTKEYLQTWQDLSLDSRDVRRLGFPQTESLLKRSLASVGGTIRAMEDAFHRGFGVNLAGGTHHAFADRGEGFCVFNDVAVASRKAQAEGWARQILIIDLDVHQGNGTAKIFADDAQVTTFSVHGARNYPFHKEQSDYDIELPDNTDDAHYLATLERALLPLTQRYDLLFLIAGVDVLAGDRFGRLALTLEGVIKRDRLIYQMCQQREIPLVYVMGGGYQTDVKQIALAHAASLKALEKQYRFC